MDRIKVLFITTWYPTKENPVEGVFVREHAKAVQLTDDVVVLHCSRRDQEFKDLWVMKQEGDENVTDRTPTFQVYYRQSRFPKTTYLVYLWSVIRAFQKIVSEGFRPDIIHAHVYKAGVPAVLIGKLYNIPVVITEHSSAFQRKLISNNEISKARFVFNRAKYVFPVSYALQKAIESYGIRAHFKIVPNVVDTSFFYPSSQAKLSRGVKKILFVGLLVPIKGIPFLFHALEQLRQERDDWQLDIIGDGPFRSQYEHLAEKLGISYKVMFHGIKSKPEVAEFMRKADLLVLSSFSETFCAVAAEALSTGTPVLATRCGGPEEFVNDKVGLLVSPGDSGALCKGLNYMLDHLDRFVPDELSRYAHELFSLTNVGAYLHTVYRQILGLDRKSFRVGYSGQRISVAEGWRVLDVGSGHNPHPRADILLEKELEEHTGRSGKAAVRDGRPLIRGDAQYLPFKNKSFDYVIASQIAEHVPGPMALCEELQRVASRGYIECPGPVGERLLGEPFHLWIVKKKSGKLIFRRKLPNNLLVQLVSDFFYALFYVGRERSRPTIKPKSWIQRRALSRLSLFFSMIWRSRWLRRWTYTCFEFNNSFDFQVLDE